MKQPIERLIQNLSKHLHTIARRCKGDENILFDEVNAMYPYLLCTADEASALLDKGGASRLAERYFESLTDEEILELSNELND